MTAKGSGQKSTRLSLLAMAGLAVLVLVLVVLNRRPTSAPGEPSPDGRKPAGTLREPGVPTPPAIAVTPVPTTSPVTGRELPFGNPPPPVVEKNKWKVNDIVAVVNARPIRVSDLSVLGLENGEIELGMTELRNYVNEELKRELVMQEAARQGLNLDAQQQWRMDRVREKYAALQPLNPAVQRQMDQELRSLEVDMKLNRLLAAQGAPSPTRVPSNAEIEAFYQANVDVYGPMPQEQTRAEVVWRKVREQIRQELIEQQHIEIGQIRDDYLNELKSNATVEVKVPGS